MKNVYKNRLLLLASFLEQLPDEKFDFRSWVSTNWDGKSEIGCGTTACALGWATTLPQLADAGLMLVKTPGSSGIGMVCLRNSVDMVDDHSPFLASKEVFNLSREEHKLLFTPSFYNDDVHGFPLLKPSATAIDVMNQIRAFVAFKYPEVNSNE